MSFEKPAAQKVDGASLRFLVVAARYNGSLVEALLRNVLEGLKRADVPEASIEVLRVPGSYEVPYAIQLGLDTGNYDAAIGLGVLIRGETSHFELIAQSVSDALQMVALNQGVPVINGVVVAENREQAENRASGQLNRGSEFAECALEMADLRKGRLVAHEQ
jgi:6,7-dimethyl-8-ribityllumazine synthase